MNRPSLPKDVPDTSDTSEFSLVSEPVSGPDVPGLLEKILGHAAQGFRDTRVLEAKPGFLEAKPGSQPYGSLDF